MLDLALTIASNGTVTVVAGQPAVVPFLYDQGSQVTAAGVQSTSTSGYVVTTYANGASARFDLVLSGSDLTVTCTAAAGAAAITGLTFVSAGLMFPLGNPTGTLQHQNYGNIRSTGTGLFYPNSTNPLGCTTADDGILGMSVYMPSERGRQSLCNASWVSDSYISQSFNLEHYTTRNIAAGTTGAPVTVMIRLTDDLSDAGLLSGYRATLPFRKCNKFKGFGGMFTVSIDAGHITDLNPYGYLTDDRRFDTVDGCRLYLQDYIPAIPAYAELINIIWAPGGYQPVFGVYPVEFGSALLTVISTFGSVVAAVKDLGWPLGIAAQFGNKLVAGSVVPADPADPADVAGLSSQLAIAAANGVTGYYVDSTGGTGCAGVSGDATAPPRGSIGMTVAARNILGPTVPFFTEMTTDITLEWADTYCEWTGTQTFRLTEQQRRHLQFLWPDAVWLCKDTSGTLTTIAAFLALKLTPLLEDATARTLYSAYVFPAPASVTPPASMTPQTVPAFGAVSVPPGTDQTLLFHKSVSVTVVTGNGTAYCTMDGSAPVPYNEKQRYRGVLTVSQTTQLRVVFVGDGMLKVSTVTLTKLP